MPKVEDISSKLHSAKTFQPSTSTLGIIIPLNEESIPETAFTSPFERYEYLKVPFGMAQAPMYFQELINKVLKDLPFAIVY